MKRSFYIYIIFSSILTIQLQAAINNTYDYVFNKEKKLITDATLYGSIYHQHHDFFNKAFSFQGIETGVILNNTIILGLYGSAFVSNLKAQTFLYNPLYVWMGQAGFQCGYIKNHNKALHTGWFVNIGIFSLKGNNEDFSVFQKQEMLTSVSGLVLSPQGFAELNITKWMRIRTGLSYNFYSFGDQSLVTKANLNNISLNFGLVFSRFLAKEQ